MSASSSIEWTDATWNPVRGCTRVSPGCQHCYAEVLAGRFSDRGQWGHGFATRDKGGRWTGRVELREDALFLPLRWTHLRRVFVNSTSDLFHEALPDAAIDRVLAVMLLAPAHTYQVLTKRAERMQAYLSDPGLYGRVLWAADQVVRPAFPRTRTLGIGDPRTRAPAWIWWGVSIEDQARAEARVPLLLRTPAAARFVSYEPALGPVDWSPWLAAAKCRDCGHQESLHGEDRPTGCQWSRTVDGLLTMCSCRKVRGEADHDLSGTHSYPPHRLDWIIVGGESGADARPFDLAWARTTIAACRTARIAPFVKQLGARPIDGNETCRGCRHAPGPHAFALRDRKGGDLDEWPAALRVREYPGAPADLPADGA